MLGRIVLVIVLIPLVELVLLSQLLERTGLATTLVLVFGTGFIGINVAKRQGLTVWRSIHEQTVRGQVPSREFVSGTMIVVAGALLITPGMITDVAGFLLLIPPFRRWLGLKLMRWFQRRTLAIFQTDGRPFPPTEPPVDDDFNGEQPQVRVVPPTEPVRAK
ncbi:MAG: FxsA family protein [Planctomycetaceae bacterium]